MGCIFKECSLVGSESIDAGHVLHIVIVAAEDEICSLATFEVRIVAAESPKKIFGEWNYA